MAACPCHIFVTGPPGVGKSTLIQRVLQQLQLPEGAARGELCGEASFGCKATAGISGLCRQSPRPGMQAKAASPAGFYTEEVRAGGERSGFDVVTLDGRRGPLARAANGAAPRVRWAAHAAAGSPLSTRRNDAGIVNVITVLRSLFLAITAGGARGGQVPRGCGLLRGAGSARLGPSAQHPPAGHRRSG
jgi:GTPase SAR1 family protein